MTKVVKEILFIGLVTERNTDFGRDVARSVLSGFELGLDPVRLVSPEWDGPGLDAKC